jgi:hypothetical protein
MRKTSNNNDEKKINGTLKVKTASAIGLTNEIAKGVESLNAACYSGSSGVDGGGLDGQ